MMSGMHVALTIHPAQQEIPKEFYIIIEGLG